MFTFCPLQGALSESSASQSLLELDGGVKILIDVGWDDSFDPEKLRELEKHVPTLSFILLTHATVPHLAAFAHCCMHFPLFTRIPVYATRPVIDLGRTLLQDLYASTPLAATTVPASFLAEVSYSYSQTAPSGLGGGADGGFLLQPPSPEEIARYFSLIQALKYSQPHQPLASPFSPPLGDLTITAYNAGHTLGGTIWHIQQGMESVVYAVDWNQARENVFAGAAWLGGGVEGGAEVIEQLRQPTALVCSSRTPGTATNAAGLSRARRDELLLENIRLCVARGGTVLIPADSSARVLELAYLLEHAWRDAAAAGNNRAAEEAEGKRDSLAAASLFLAGRNVSSTMRHARSMLEWMDDGIVREFEAVADSTRRTNGNAAADGGARGGGKEAGPFDFKHLRLLERKAQVERMLAQTGEDGQPVGKVILASDTSLEWGFSRDVLRSIATDSRNLVILTEKPASTSSSTRPSLAATLWEWWKERRDGVATEQTNGGDSFEQVYGGGRDVEMTDARRQPLEGAELTLYQQWLATQRQLQATQQAGGASALEAPGDAVDDASSESSSDSEGSETEQQGKALNVSTTLGQTGRKKVVLRDEDLGITILLKRKGVHDFDVRGKRGRERMFPVTVRRKRNDDFGEAIRPEDFLRAEERGDEAPEGGQVGQHPEGQDGLGKKRKWDDVGGGAGGGRRAPAVGGNKRPQPDRNVSADDDLVALPFADGQRVRDELDTVEDEEEDEVVLGPAKLVTSTETLSVNLRIAFVDFSGLHDKRSLTMLIPLIQPRKLILVAGGEEETRSLAADCEALLGGGGGGGGDTAAEERRVSVLVPAVGRAVDASVDTNAWVVRLTDSLVRRLDFKTVGNLQVMTITGRLVGAAAGAGKDAHNHPVLAIAGDEEGANKRLKIEGGEATDPDGEDGADSKQLQTTTALDGSADEGQEPAAVVPTLDVLPTALVAATRGAAAQPLHVGDLRLADLRRAMQGLGHTAEFRGEGTLLIDGSVAVRKSATGRIELESIGLPTDGGPAVQQGGTFYAVKKRIYAGLAVVAGG